MTNLKMEAAIIFEPRDVPEGKLPDGSKIPVFQFDEFKRGIKDLPIRYGVILDFGL